MARWVVALAALCALQGVLGADSGNGKGTTESLGLFLRSQDGKFVVTQAASDAVSVGATLVSANGFQVSSRPFAEALQDVSKPFLLPLVSQVDDGDEAGYPLEGFVRVEYVDPYELAFVTEAGGEQKVVLRDAPKKSRRGTKAQPDRRAAEKSDELEEVEVEGSTYVVVVTKVGPLGFQLATNPLGRVAVGAIAPGSSAEELGIMVGDALLSVNGNPVVKGVSVDNVVSMLSAAVYPKKLELKMSTTRKDLAKTRERVKQRAAQRAAEQRDAAEKERREHATAAAEAAARRARNRKPGAEPKNKPGTPDPRQQEQPKQELSAHAKAQAKAKADADAAIAAAAAALEDENALPENEYEAVYTAGSMGLEFDATADGLVVSGVIRGSSSDKAGVKPGDRVVLVNHESIEELDFRGGVNAIISAEWPKTLQLRKPEVEEKPKDPNDEGNGWIELTSPDIVQGVRLPLKSGLFGPPLASCTRTVTFVIANPVMLCKDQPPIAQLLAARGNDFLLDDEDGDAVVAAPAVDAADGAADGAVQVAGDGVQDEDETRALVYLIALRGACTFPIKANKATLCGADGLVVVSNNAGVVRMPGDPSVRSNVSTAMVDQQDGSMLSAAATVAPILGRIMMNDVDGCQLDGKPLLPLLGKAGDKLERERGGRLLLWNGTDSAEVPFVQAIFGPNTNASSVARLVRANPFHGCLLDDAVFKNVAELAHNFAIVERGVCAFSDKIRNLQKLGVKAVVVVNTDDKLMPMPAAPPFDDIVTPSIMVGRSFLTSDLVKIQRGRPGKEPPPPMVLGRIVRHDDRNDDDDGDE